MPLASRALAFALYQDGWLAEYRADDGDWTLAKSPLWGPHMRYRICAKPEELVLPSIDWSAVHADFRWLAQDECGDAYLTSARPRATGEEWLEGCKYAEACGFSSFKRGKGDWTKLLVERSA